MHGADAASLQHLSKFGRAAWERGSYRSRALILSLWEWLGPTFFLRCFWRVLLAVARDVTPVRCSLGGTCMCAADLERQARQGDRVMRRDRKKKKKRGDAKANQKRS